jgi:mannose-1-phosphate guanylyltransferase
MDWTVVLAGGRGERFWPLSRRQRPKQFLRLLSSRTMLQETVARAGDGCPERVVVVTGAEYADLVAEQLPDVPPENILGEPSGRNTGPSVAWACRVVMERDPDAVLTVMPSDHAMEQPDRFRAALRQAREHARHHQTFTLFGVVPRWPDTGFGYIETTLEAGPVKRVLRFVEKPDAALAADMVASGRYLWNSGMFVLPVQPLWQAFETHLPAVAAAVDTVTRDPERLHALFPQVPSVSIDVGIMERMTRLAVVPLDAGWDDVGTFQAVARLLASRQPERVAFEGSTNVTVIGDEGPWVATVGTRDLVIVRTRDVVLVLAPEEAQAVRGLVAQLREGPGHVLL